MFTKSNLTVLAVICITMIGCGSFNTYHFPAPVVIVTPKGTGTALPPVAIPEECMYRMPKLEPIPEVPIQELERIGDQDDAALDKIQKDYMKELRTFIRKRQAVHRSAYQDYLKRCTPLVAQSDGKNTE